MHFFLSLTGYQDLDLHQPQASGLGQELRRCQKSWQSQSQRSTNDPKLDKTWAKVMNCSGAWLAVYKNWVSMNQANVKVMKKKFAAGQVRRNVIGAKDAKTAEEHF